MQIKKADLVNGPITRTIFSFSLPIIIGSLIQVLFNMADQVVLGQMAGTVAVAAVGACGPAISLVINSFSGLSLGVTVLLTRTLGAGDHERARRIISTALFAAVGIGAISASVGILSARALLTVTNCPSECLNDSILYITIYYASAPVILLYNFSSSILRVTGDTQRPLIYMILAGVLNVVMNVVLCLILTQKVAAVAIATLSSQALGAILVVVRLCRVKEGYRFDPRKPVFDWGVFGKLLRYGVPNALNSAFYPFSNLQILANINTFGTAATAGYSAAVSLTGITSSVVGGFNHTTAALVGQNLGAQRPDRVGKSIRQTLLWSMLIAETVGLVSTLLHVPLLGLYLPDSKEAIAFGLQYMLHVTCFYFITAANGVFSSSLNAFGYSTFTALSSLLSVVAFRPVWLATVYRAHPDFPTLMLCFTVSWLLLLSIHIPAFAIVYRRYRNGKLKKL